MATEADNMPEDLMRFIESQKAAGLTEQEAIATAIGLLRRRQVELARARYQDASAFDVAKRNGFIGAAGPGLPGDLSADPKHLASFGRGAS